VWGLSTASLAIRIENPHSRRAVSLADASIPFMREEELPFLGQDAIRRGFVTARRLEKDYQAIYRNVYVHRRTPITALLRARAAWLWSGGDAVLVCLSAAAVHGAKWIDPDVSAEISRRDRHSPSGITVHTYALDPSECCTVDGMRLTTPSRTAFDIGRTYPPDRAVVHLDALARATGLKAVDVLGLADLHPGVRGVRRLREVMSRVDGGAESPQETRLRMVLIKAGIPTPETQIEFRDRYGTVRVRVDMGWREWKVAVEYDGVQHWTDKRQRTWDIDRIAMLEASGWVVVRVSAEMLTRPDVIVQRVREKLRAAGCPI
jgi:very-short-patch-repair endonuclease